MKKRIFARIGLFCFIVFILLRCEYEKIVPVIPPVISPNEKITFNQDVFPIFEKYNCKGCHPPAVGLDLTSGKAYKSIKNNNLYNLNDPESSNLYKILLNQHSGITLLAEEKNIILEWIKKGAVEDISGAIPDDNHNNIDTNKTISYFAQILPLLNEKCINCHSEGTTFVLAGNTAYETIVKNNFADTLAPESSILVSIFNEGQSHNKKLEKSEIDLIFYWIKQGAINDSPKEEISFSKDIVPIFTNRCLTCHNSGKTKPDLSAENAFNSLNNKELFNKDNPEESDLYKIFLDGKSHNGRMEDSELALILQWIKKGAQNN